MSSDQNQQGTSILGMPGSNIEYRQESGDLSNQKQSNMNEKHMGAYANPMPEDLGNSTSFSSQGKNFERFMPCITNLHLYFLNVINAH